MDKIEHFDNINGKRVGVILIFDSYREGQYKRDFEEFVNYQKKFGLTGEKGETDFRFYRQVKEFTLIPYNVFREYSANFFSKAMFYLLKHNPEFIVSDELNIQIKLLKVKGRSYYFEYQDDASDPENACFDGAGIWFIQSIVAPFFYFRHIDFSYILRYFLHEMTHFSDQMKDYLSFDKRYEKKIKSLARRKSAYCLNYLYSSMFNLREEGLADFFARRNSPQIDINMEGIRDYNKNLQKLAEMTRKKEAEEFYKKRIGWENLTPSCEYTNGRVMCLFIALSVAKNRRSPYYILVGKNKFYGYEFHDLDRLLSSNKIIYISNLSRDAINEAISLIKPRPHYYFIKLYESACNNLGISDRNMVMTSRRFYELKKRAIENARIEKKNRLRRHGFENIETEVREEL